MPLKGIRPSYFRQSSLSNPVKNQTNPSASLASWLSAVSASILISVFALGGEAVAAAPIRQTQSQSLVKLEDIIPTQGPAGTNPVASTPSGPFEVNSNAVATAAVDFVDAATSLNRATVLGIKTLDRTYDHDYSICGIFHGYAIEAATALPLTGMAGTTDTPWFWYTAMTKREFVQEAFLFAVFVDERSKTFTVDSRRLSYQYMESATPPHDYIFNFQIWSSSSAEAQRLLLQTLANLANFGSGWKLKYANTSQPAAPSLLITYGELAGNTVKLTVKNWLAQPQAVKFDGFFRYPNNRDANLPFSYSITLQPGFNQIELPLGNILDAVINLQTDRLVDKAYIGSGGWFDFHANDPNSNVNFVLTDNSGLPNNLTTSDFILAGGPQITGTVGAGGWAGMARTLNPSDLPVDISQYHALTFFARGDGKSYRVALETDAVRQLGSTDFHQFVFTTSPAWRQYIIPLSVFVQQGWDPNKLVPFTGKDVVSIAWQTIGAPLDSIDLAVDRVALTNAVLISGTTVLPNTTDSVGPYAVNTQVAGDREIATVDLYYSVDGGLTFNPTPMLADGNNYGALMPGQPLGTEVRYYIQAASNDNNVATDPVDIPYKTHRFQISQHPYLLVDDFADTDPVNVLGGISGCFASDNGSCLLYYENQSLRLNYNVSAPNSYAGYYSLLQQANLSSYSAITFLVKGGVGGERVQAGLRDTAMNETKVLIGGYLPQGITSSWQKVTIPLTAFTSVIGWTDMNNISLTAESSIGSGAGTIYLDDIRFEYIPSVTPPK